MCLLFEDFWNAVESKCCSVWTRIPPVFRGLVWRGPLDKGRGGTDFECLCQCIFVYVQNMQLDSVPSYFYGISSLEGKEIASPQTNPGFASSLSDISFPNSPHQEMRRFCFHTLWSYRFGLTRVRFTQRSSETPGELCRVSVQLLLERLSWGGADCSSSQDRIPWTCTSSAFFWKAEFVLDAVGRRNTPSRDSDCGGGRGALGLGQGLFSSQQPAAG